MSPHNVANVGSDGTPCPPVFTVDETTPHALVIVPVPAGAGGRVIQQIDPEQPRMGRRTRGTFGAMGRAASLPPPGFDGMSVEDKIDYVEALWDRIAANESQVPVPQWHRDVLRERIADYQADREQGRPWEDVEADLLKRRK
jgi:putative addiction module component (TIGR02574 family)